MSVWDALDEPTPDEEVARIRARIERMESPELPRLAGACVGILRLHTQVRADVLVSAVYRAFERHDQLQNLRRMTPWMARTAGIPFATVHSQIRKIESREGIRL
jgi:hypothetical protein